MTPRFWKQKSGSTVEYVAVGAALVAAAGALCADIPAQQLASDGELPTIAFVSPDQYVAKKSKPPSFNSIDYTATGSVDGQNDRSGPVHGASKALSDGLSAPAKSAPVDKIGWIAILVGTTVVIAWSNVLARFLDVGPLAGAAWRMGLAVPALALWARLASGRRLSLAEPAAAPILLLLAGLAFAADVGSFHIALTGTKVANASFIGNIAPVLTVAGGAVFFAEHPAPRVWVALALALLGSWVMAGMGAPTELGFGDIFALCASVAYASYLLVIKQLRARLDGPTATLWSAAVSAIALAIAATLRGETLLPHSSLGWTMS